MPEVDFLTEPASDAFDRFAGFCSAEGVDVDALADVATATVRYLKTSKGDRDALRDHQALELRWYRALDAGTVDWSVYDDPAYLADLWACWVLYSRRYIAAVAASKWFESVRPSVRAVVDVGCGFGGSTAALKQLFPGVPVFGTNRPGITQTRVASRYGEAFGFTVVENGDPDVTPGRVLVFASEYFEHFYNPVAHLNFLSAWMRPDWWVIASTFNSRSIGHFPAYRHNSEVVPGRAIGRRFNGQLRADGFRALKLGFWNNRPAVWERTAEPK